MVGFFEAGGSSSCATTPRAEDVLAQLKRVPGAARAAAPARRRAGRSRAAAWRPRASSCSRASGPRRRSAAATTAASSPPSGAASVDVDLERLERLRRHEEAGELRPMAVVRYHQYIGELWDDLDLEDAGRGAVRLPPAERLRRRGGRSGTRTSCRRCTTRSSTPLMRRGLLSDEDLQKLMDDARRARAVPAEGGRAHGARGLPDAQREPALPRPHPAARRARAGADRRSSSS